MIRRRRRVRDIPFSFDSFLDIVANVVGVIIRLILVVWVGAKSYSTLREMAQPATVAVEAGAETAGPADPLEHDLAEHRRELARLQKELLAQMEQVQVAEGERLDAEAALAAAAGRRLELEREAGRRRQDATAGSRAAEAAALSLEELRRRREKLAERLRDL